MLTTIERIISPAITLKWYLYWPFRPFDYFNNMGLLKVDLRFRNCLWPSHPPQPPLVTMEVIAESPNRMLSLVHPLFALLFPRKCRWIKSEMARSRGGVEKSIPRWCRPLDRSYRAALSRASICWLKPILWRVLSADDWALKKNEWI